MFRTVPNFPNYKISDTGFLCRGPRILKLRKNLGYIRYRLYSKGGSSDIGAHQLVARAFLDNPEGKPFVNHKNGIKDDNRVENLEWCTASENSLHARETGLSPTGAGMPNAKLTEDQVRDIRSRLGSCTPIAKEFGVSRQTVFRVRKGQMYRRVS